MKLYTNKRQLKTLIRKYKKLIDKEEQNILKDKKVNEAITTLLLINSKQGTIIDLCNQVISNPKSSKELKQFATRVKHNI